MKINFQTTVLYLVHHILKCTFEKHNIIVFYGNGTIPSFGGNPPRKGMVKFMKKVYISPEIELIEFDVDDIITESGLKITEGDTEFTPPSGWWS